MTFYQGKQKHTHYRVWLVRALSGTRTDHGVHPEAAAKDLAAQLIQANPLDTIHCVPAGGAVTSDKELDQVFDRIKRRGFSR